MVMPIIKMQVDGQYFETLVSGYRTLTVEGREELDLDVINAEIDTSDGGRYLRRKIKSRVLNVRFAVEDSTPEGFAVKFKALKAELYKIKESRIIFTDEPNIYFTGTFRKITAEYIGHTVAQGVIEISCADPFKYSVTETTVTAVNGTITATYNGTYPAHPKLIARSTGHDCGYYGFTKDGITVRVGNPDEQDQEEVPTDTATALIEQNFGKWESTPRDGKDFKKAKEFFACSHEGGESTLKLAQRIYNLLDDIKAESVEKTYILVAHNGIARVVQSYFTDMTNEEYAAFGVKNCQVVRYDFEE